MGFHITVKNLNYERHPGWDYIRYGPDHDFRQLLLAQPYAWVRDLEDNDIVGFRPIDLIGLRQNIEESDLELKSRYLWLCDILESDKQWYIDISV